MRVEDRTGVFGAGTQIIIFCESEAEAEILDLLGKPGDKVQGELRLSDGYGVFYVLLKPNE